jgi:hypothetical protein
MNKFERDALKQIDELNEGLLGQIAKMFMARKVKRQYKKAYKIAKDDPELQSALADLEGYHERLNDILKGICKRNPNNPYC